MLYEVITDKHTRIYNHFPMIDSILSDTSYFYEPTMQMKVIKRDPELPYRLHSHEFNELVFVVSGRGVNFTATDQLALREGSVFFIPPGVEHGFKDVDNLVLYNIIYAKNLLGRKVLDLADLPGYCSSYNFV